MLKPSNPSGPSWGQTHPTLCHQAPVCRKVLAVPEFLRAYLIRVMQIERKTVKQDKVLTVLFVLKLSQRPLVPPQGLWIIFWATSLSGFTDTKTPTKWKKLPHADHKQVDPTPVGTRRLMMLTPEIPPCYLTTNQSDRYPKADLAPCDPVPHLAFKHPSLKAIREFASFEYELPILLAWPHNGYPSVSYPLLHHNLVSTDWLCCVMGEWNQVWFGYSINHHLSAQ